MKKSFKCYSENIRLTSEQNQDARIKYSGVCKKLHDSYYNSNYTGETKHLFGSYKTRTNIRPIVEDQDVDVLFKIPKETYEKFVSYTSNGPAALLQEIKNSLKEKYTTTDNIKPWGKVVKVTFTNGKHNVEVLPAFEQEDGTFIIPNSEQGGSWDCFDPRKQSQAFFESNKTTKGLTADLVRMIKSWVRNTSSCMYKSYQVVNHVIDFLNLEYSTGAEFSEYSSVIYSFFRYLNSRVDCTSIHNHILTAFNRAEKAIKFENELKYKEASIEWNKIFGDLFPLVPSTSRNLESTRIFSNPSRPYAKN